MTEQVAKDELIQCSGCGIVLQTEDPDAPGYVPESALQRERPVCRRCFRIRHYGEFSRIVVPHDVYEREVSAIARHPGLVLYVLDVFDLPGSIIPGLDKLIGPSDVVAIVNKVDLLPREVHVETLEGWILRELRSAGIRATKVLFVSAQSGRGTAQIVQELRDTKREVAYVVGMANVGKSTLLNRLLRKQKLDEQFTASRVPGTTIGMNAVQMELDGGKRMVLVDTPGLIHGDRLIDHLCGQCLKAVLPQSAIHPRIYQLDPGQTLWLGGFARFDFVSGPHQPIVCYVSNDLVVHRTKLERAEVIGSEHADDILKAPCPNCRDALGDKTLYRIRGERQRPQPSETGPEVVVPLTGCDIVLSGLGWITLQGHNIRGYLHAPRQVKVTVRPRLVGGISRGIVT
jgi:ribosome biogenesis GTPase YqeH